jgi:hypothetical protein
VLGIVIVLVISIVNSMKKQEAQKNYISALQNYWLNYYKIRKLTLHDFESGFSLADKFDFNTGIYR